MLMRAMIRNRNWKRRGKRGLGPVEAPPVVREVVVDE